jgi:hypothetical protein
MLRCSLSVCLVILMWDCSMSSGKRYPVGVLDATCMLTMTKTCLGPKSSSMRFGYSYFTGHEIFNLWFLKHMLRNYARIKLNHSRCLWWGQWELNSKYHNFWRFINLQSLLPFVKGISFTFMLSLHFLPWCTV